MLTFSLTLTLKRGRTTKILSLFCISFISGHLFYTWIENTTVTFHVLCLSFVFSLLSGNIQMTAISRNKRGWYLKKKYASNLTSILETNIFAKKFKFVHIFILYLILSMLRIYLNDNSCTIHTNISELLHVIIYTRKIYCQCSFLFEMNIYACI